MTCNKSPERSPPRKKVTTKELRRPNLRSTIARVGAEVMPAPKGSSRMMVVVEGHGGISAGIAMAQSKFERGIRKMIGGGEMREWKIDPKFVRCGRRKSKGCVVVSSDSPRCISGQTTALRLHYTRGKRGVGKLGGLYQMAKIAWYPLSSTRMQQQVQRFEPS